jgi:hypothetical protein
VQHELFGDEVAIELEQLIRESDDDNRDYTEL